MSDARSSAGRIAGPEGLTIGVVGAGTMGRGIVQLFVQAGHRVICHDQVAGSATRALDSVAEQLRRGVEKGRIEPAELQRCRERMSAASDLNDLAPCALVVEAVAEDLEVKRGLFVGLEAVLSASAVLVSNTSSLMIADIAAACEHPHRVAGLHFFNPVPLMKVVEVIGAVRTSPEVIAMLRQLVEAAGHRAILAADQPGFLINHAGRGLYTEGLRLLEERVADVAEIDRVLTEAAGFRMGPFELLDLTGLDVSSKVMTSIYEQFQQDPRYRPSSLVPPRVAARLLGRKSGEGWYRYADGGKGTRLQAPRQQPAPELPAGLRVWVAPDAPQRSALRALVETAGAIWTEVPAEGCLAIVQPWGADATGEAVALDLDPRNCVALDPLPGFSVHRTLMLTSATTSAMRDAAHALLAADGCAVTVINDSPGFIVQRVLATIVNIAANIAQRGIASVSDIDDAVRLGLGYPRGPLAWGDEIGGDRVLTILRGLQAVTGDPRYRPSPWLERRVALRMSLRTPEAARS